jgi:hypothetical protein
MASPYRAAPERGATIGLIPESTASWSQRAAFELGSTISDVVFSGALRQQQPYPVLYLIWIKPQFRRFALKPSPDYTRSGARGANRNREVY